MLVGSTLALQAGEAKSGLGSVLDGKASQTEVTFFADFESPTYRLGGIHGQQGWLLDQGQANVVAGSGRSGSAGLVLSPASPFTQARLSLQTSAAHGPISFVDLYLRPLAGENQAKEEMIDIDSARVGLFRTEKPDLAVLSVFNGNGSGGGTWMETPLQIAIDPKTGQTLGWHRLTLREDANSQSWDLWLDGVWACAGMGFQEPRPAGGATCIFMGDRLEPLALDELRVGPANPFGQDTDGDGLLDYLETRLGLDPNKEDRDEDLDDDGVRNLEQWMAPMALFVRKVVSVEPTIPVVLELSNPSAIVEGPLNVSVKVTGKTGTLFYTLDGSDPVPANNKAKKSLAPKDSSIPITKSSVLRVAAVDQNHHVQGQTTAAYLFPSEIARFTRPDRFPMTLPEYGIQMPITYGNPKVGSSTLTESAVRAALEAAPIVVLAASPDAWFSQTNGIYSLSLSKLKTVAEVVCFQSGGASLLTMPHQATVSLSGESSLSHFTTTKHSLRLKWTQKPEVASTDVRLGGIATGQEILLRHPTQDSWVQAGSRKERREGLYFADAFAASTMGLAGHQTLNHQWVHVFLNGSYWGVYDAVEQVSQPVSGVSTLLKGEQSGAVGPIFGTAERWNLLMKKLQELSKFAQYGIVIPEEWEAIAAEADLDNLIDYILTNVWMQTADWPNRNFLITSKDRLSRFGFLCWDAEYALHDPLPTMSEPLARIREAQDGPAGLFTKMANWAPFRKKVLDRAQVLFTTGAFSPTALRAELQKQANAFRPLASLEAARWSAQYDLGAQDVLAVWEARVAELTQNKSVSRGPVVLEEVTKWAAALDRSAAALTQRLAAESLRPIGPLALIRPAIVMVIDADGDGIPDAWERRFALNANDAADAASDSDKDGFSNLEEWALGLDPTKADPKANYLPQPTTSVFTRIQNPVIRQGKRLERAENPNFLANPEAGNLVK